METSVSIYQMNSERSETEKAIEEKLEPNDLCFYRFIGGNSSETDALTNQLCALKEKKVLLIGVFRFPFRFEGKKRFRTAITQYFRMKELCDSIIYFNSDGLLETIDTSTTIRDANTTFNAIEEHTIDTLKEMIEMTGEMNIDFQDIESFIANNRGPLFLHTVEEESFDEPLKYLISTPYLPKDFTDGKQLIINIGYTRDVDMEAFRQINLRLHDLFSKADLFKLGSYFIDEPGQSFKITLLVNGIDDPIETPGDYKKVPKYRGVLHKWKILIDKAKEKTPI
ncbi:cell division protein FtsZ [Aquibacillus sp. 3ASR75-11]|uniref:Cell division protein FtsZ n=1 Tax=Terrihalobacillus insolitus TaxID=2950438 RepID=A0A9X3WUZ2_9BACI|nr:cell division protein FtsZ [Terrihalobacillus insolitus]MDC3413837.1 cell division protein FtsZ [Terrihalobacillus insolitus]MDC3424516.1 cell division protein FtsZ [Terrihalobacillus insolitus]